MKKIFISILMIVFFSLLFFCVPHVQAEEVLNQADISQEDNESKEMVDLPIELNGENYIENKNEKYKLELKIGEFTTTEQKNIMAFEATLNYNSEMFNSVEIKGKNGWTIEYDKETKRVVGMADESVPNSVIAEFEFEVNADATSETIGRISLENFYITNDADINKSENILLKENIKLSSNIDENRNSSKSEKSYIKFIVIAVIIIIVILFFVPIKKIKR